MSAAPVSVIGLRPDPSIKVVSVTPAMAQEWLTHNEVNRNIRTHDVEKYARAMIRGQWALTGEAIKFSSDGKLLDGQHRLTAIMRAKQPVQLVVIHGIDESAQLEMDSGARRTASDALGFLGETSTALLAAAARLAFLVDNDLISADRKKQGVSHGEIAEYINANPDIRDAVQATLGLRKFIDMPPSVICVAYYYLRRIHQTRAEEFFHSLSTRANLPDRSAILALDSRLRTMRNNGTRASQRDYLTLVFKAWNYWRKDRPAASLALGGKLPEPK